MHIHNNNTGLDPWEQQEEDPTGLLLYLNGKRKKNRTFYLHNMQRVAATCLTGSLKEIGLNQSKCMGSGSVSFWYGSGSSDPFLRKTTQDPT